jgi:hypothetical protein
VRVIFIVVLIVESCRASLHDNLEQTDAAEGVKAKLTVAGTVILFMVVTLDRTDGPHPLGRMRPDTPTPRVQHRSVPTSH